MLSVLLSLFILASFSGASVFAQETLATESEDVFIVVPEQLERITDPLQQVATSIATFAGQQGVLIVGALFYLLIAYLAGRGFGDVARRIIDRTMKGSFAKRIQETVDKAKKEDDKFEGFEEEDEDAFTNPRNLIPKTVSWFFYVIGIVAALNAVGVPEISNAMAVVALWIPKLISAIIIIVLGSVLVKFALAWIVGRKWFGKESEDYKTIQTALKIIVYSMVIAIALTQIDIGQDIIPILVQAFAWGIAAAFAIAVGWGMKDIVPSLWMQRENKHMGMKIGNVIELKSDKGTIDRIGRTQLRIKTEDGKFIVIPHKDLLDVHFSLTEKTNSDQK